MSKKYYILILINSLFFGVIADNKSKILHILKNSEKIMNDKVIRASNCMTALANSECIDTPPVSQKERCNTYTSEKCLNFYDDFASFIPECKNYENYSCLHSTMKAAKDTASTYCITDNDGNFCSYSTLPDFLAVFDIKNFTNKTIIDETCKSKKCTDGFIKYLNIAIDRYNTELECIDKDLYDSLPELIEHCIRLKNQLTSNECISQSKNDQLSDNNLYNSTESVDAPNPNAPENSGHSKLKYFNLGNIFGPLMLIMTWWMYNLL